MDFSLSAAERDLVELCRDFARKEIAPRAPIAWQEARCPTDLLREMGELGLLGMLIPEEWGGIGMTTFAIGLWLMSTVHVGTSNLDIAWRMALCGLGFGFFQAPNNRTMLGSAPRERAGAAGGMLATARLTGMTGGAMEGPRWGSGHRRGGGT